jgi:hypothetical protein
MRKILLVMGLALISLVLISGCINQQPPDSKKTMTKELCESARGHWNDCGSKCYIDNQGKPDIVCPAVCEQLCECGGIAGFGCPEGYICKMPSGIADAMGYCE